MKYIRTKDGVFRKYKNTKIIDNVFYYPDDGMFPEYRREPILNQADTIEELCDEYVVFGEHIIPSHTHFLSLTDIGIKSFLEAKAIIYGAIWTKWGLKYVAKMNDKGELELL